MAGKVIAIIQGKGGSGKTTTAINIVGGLEQAGYKAILADMDKEKPDAMLIAGKGLALKDKVQLVTDDNPTPIIDELKAHHDFVIIDVPPNFQAAALKAAFLADLVIIPCAPSETEIDALAKSTAVADFAKKPYRFLANRVVMNTRIGKLLIEQISSTNFGFQTVISSSTAMVECQSAGNWVGGYDKSSISKQQVMNLVDEIVETFK